MHGVFTQFTQFLCICMALVLAVDISNYTCVRSVKILKTFLHVIRSQACHGRLYEL